MSHVVEATAFEVMAYASEEARIIHAVMERGIAVGIYFPEQKLGGLTIVTGSKGARSKMSIDELLKRLKEMTGGSNAQPVVKLVAARLVGGPVQRIRDILKEHGLKPSAEVLEEAKVELYFYSDTGRVRVGVEKGPEPTRGPDPLAEIENEYFRKKKVLIVDDSKIICQLLTKILSGDASLEVVGAAERPSEAERMIEKFKPDVITLDIHMPEMNGVQFLSKYLQKYPIPTVMISSISLEEGSYVLQALENGAVDYIQKPSFEELDRVAPLIVEKVKMAANIRVGARTSRGAQKRLSWGGRINNSTLVAIGASTGGTEALKQLFIKLPAVIPPVVVVQHIPPVFSAAFAHRLGELCPFKVKEAQNGDKCLPNQVLIAPGGLQMAVEPDPSTGGFKVKIFDGEPVNRHKPSVDVLFNSVAQHVGKKAVGLIMTGMGRDGAQGLLAMRLAGARTMAQDESSSVVFGMPKEAIKLGAAEAVHALEAIPEHLLAWLQNLALLNNSD